MTMPTATAPVTSTQFAQGPPVPTSNGSTMLPIGTVQRVPAPPEPGKASLRRTSSLNGNVCIQWNVDARKFGGHNTKAVSPEFLIDLPGQGAQPFKLMIMPIVRGVNKTQVKQALGKVDLKCLGDLRHDAHVSFCLGIGSEAQTQPMRGPVSHNFAI